MRFIVVDSGSSANGFILEGNTSALVIEAGVTFKRVSKAIDFNVSKIDGCLITHEHGDHCKYRKQLRDRGVKLYASGGTMSALNEENINQVESMKEVKIGEFKVKPFDVRHDAAEPFGFLIHHRECGNIVFAIDTYYIPYRFKSMNHLIVEANYSQEILDYNVQENVVHPLVRNRVMKGHMEITTLGRMLKANNLDNLSNIILIHLSKNNSDKKQFKQYIEGISGVPTIISERNVIVEL